MYSKNVPPVPVINSKNVINAIDKKVMQLTDEEKESISEIISFHECEPSAAAERIADLLQVDYSAIFDLL